MQKTYQVLRAVFVPIGFVVTILTAPVVAHHDIPEGFKWWRNELDRIGGDSLQLIVLGLGLLMIAGGLFAPRLATRGTPARQFSGQIRREGRRALKRRRKRERRLAKEITHRQGCPAERIEFYPQTRPDGQTVETVRCVDCGDINYFDSDGRLLEVGSPQPTTYVSQKQQVVNECIERGVALRNDITLEAESIQVNWIGGHAEKWAKETWELLGSEVPEWRGLFHMQTHSGFEAPEIMDYLDMRMAELRTILGKLG